MRAAYSKDEGISFFINLTRYYRYSQEMHTDPSLTLDKFSASVI